MNFDHKIVLLSSLEEYKVDGSRKLVLAGGCFDLLHYGHIMFIKKAREAGDVLMLLLESDEFIKLRKKKKPVHTQRQRAEILASLGYVDHIVLLPLLKNPDVEYGEIIKKVVPSIIAYTIPDSKETQKKKFAGEVHAKTLAVPYLTSFSSSSLITYAPIFRD